MQQYGQDAMVSRLLAEGIHLCRTGRFAQAKAIYDRIMMLAPQRVEPYLNCGQIGLAEGQYDDALSWFEKVRRLKPDLPPALEGAGAALLALGRPAEALAIFERLQTLDAKSSAALHGAGEALKQLGRLKEARAVLERAIELAPDVAGHHYLLAQLARFVENDPRLAGLERLRNKAASLPEPDRCQLHFALGKAYDELGRHAQAFEHWRAANAIKRRHIAYDESMFLGILRDLAAAFTPEVMAARYGAGDPSRLPVFVVGMPRSGTTLVAQIIASHPDAFNVGESMYLHYLLGQNRAGPDFPAHFTSVPKEGLRNMGAFYVAHLNASAPKASRIVDKLTANFMLCGLIRIILPNARIIHVRRDPLDTCLSCYANLFSQNIDYSYDLGELGRYYRAYETLMAHWRRILPEGAMLEVSYEELVSDFPAQARRIVGYCGLGWDEACLSFHLTKRVVHTLSAVQVRQPVYGSSVGRWKAYASHLGPLIEALGAAR